VFADLLTPKPHKSKEKDDRHPNFSLSLDLRSPSLLGGSQHP